MKRPKLTGCPVLTPEAHAVMTPHMTLTCPCGSTVDVKRTSSVGDIRTESGWFHFMNQRNGLETMWLCPACNVRALEAVAILVEVFKEQAPYIYFGNLFR